VLCSILNTYVKEDWFSLCSHEQDLMLAPGLLVQGSRMLAERCTVVHYERLLEDPAAQMRRLCAALDVAFVPEMLEYGRQGRCNWHFGDQKVHQYTAPVGENAARWVQELARPQVWRLANDYLQALGRETVYQMGYSVEELQHILDARRPQRMRLWRTCPLAWLLMPPTIRGGVRGGARAVTHAGTRRFARMLS
jgi:hypothetical protein